METNLPATGKKLGSQRPEMGPVLDRMPMMTFKVVILTDRPRMFTPRFTISSTVARMTRPRMPSSFLNGAEVGLSPFYKQTKK